MRGRRLRRLGLLSGCSTLSPAALSKLKDMVAEHLDNLFYLNDILCLKVHAINEVLTAQVIKKLLIPLYVHSLVPLYALQVNDQVRLASLPPPAAVHTRSHRRERRPHRPKARLPHRSRCTASHASRPQWRSS